MWGHQKPAHLLKLWHWRSLRILSPFVYSPLSPSCAILCWQKIGNSKQANSPVQKSCRILFVECLLRESWCGLSQGETLLYQSTGPLVLQSEYFALWNAGIGSQDAVCGYQSSNIWLLLRLKWDLANVLAQGDSMQLLPRQNCCDSSFATAVSLLCWLQTHLTFRSILIPICRLIEFWSTCAARAFFVWHIVFSCCSLTYAEMPTFSGRTLAHRGLCMYTGKAHIGGIWNSCNLEGGSGSKCSENQNSHVSLD